MSALHAQLPDAEVALGLEPEELGIYLLQALKDRRNNQGQVILNNEIGPLADPYGNDQERIRDAIAEAWAWLESQGLLVPAWRSGGGPPWRVLSRRARSVESPKDLAALRHSNALPKEFLHSRIPPQVRLNFLRGDFDAAVGQAMKQVEIALRDATNIKNESSGVRIARRAFHPEDGPLTEMGAEGGEKQGMMELFAGTLATLKNPHSHRNVELTDPADAAAAILMASYLLRVIDARAEASRRSDGSAAE